MRRRLPSPALVIASAALFVALAGAGWAASLYLVRSPSSVTLISGSMSADGKLIGGLSHGTERSPGVYTLTINGDTFAANNRYYPHVRALVSPRIITLEGQNKVIDPTCDTSAGSIAPDGSAILEVDCFTYDPVAGWQPAEAAFDFQVIGPPR